MVFTVKDVMGNTLTLRYDRHRHILERPEMLNQDDRIKATLRKPEVIKESIHSADVLLYYKLYDKTPVTKKYMLVVAKVNNIITAFYTNKIKKGKTKWER